MTRLIKEMSSSDDSFNRNHLLTSLPPEERNYWKPLLKLVALPLNHIICESGDKPAYMFFPTTAIVSLMYLTQDGTSSEVTVIGNDGTVGISLFLSNSPMINQAIVQTAGEGFILPASLIKNVFNRSDMLKTLLSYSQDMITQLIQNSVSRRHFSIQQQLSRRLLLGLDRMNSNELTITHERLANMLGVRRESVTEAAMKLQECGAISYSRGHLTVLDRHILEKSCHDCYSYI